MKNCQIAGLGAEAIDLINIFDAIFGVANPIATSHLPEPVLAGKFPPCDILRDEKEGTLKYKFAVAGYSDSEIDVQFKDDYMTVTLNPTEKDQGDFKFIQKGIKASKASVSAYIPSSKFDVDKFNADIKDGILTITVPEKPEAKPRKITINNSN